MTDIWYRDTSSLLDELRGLGDDPARPSIVGYEDLREIGRGGQGVVYRAREAASGRDVAIKVLLQGVFASDASRRRFEREVELIGELSHPNIVRVFSSGVTHDGRLYYVMELIEGEPFDEACERWGDDRVRMLAVFASVAEAVGFAHQRGVIHRDLKPGNIRIDADGAPRVLDFGIAKSELDEDATEASPTPVSVTGQFVGSLPWASPEQAAGKAVDTRSDVYSLGVVLYQSLTGRFPYPIVGTLREVLESVASAEPTKPRTIDDTIADDLQTILLRCLGKDPERRYQSAMEVAREIRRFLAGEPIEAKRDTAMHTLRSAVRRHRVATAIGSVAILSLAAFGTTMTMLYERTLDAEDLASTKVSELEAEQLKVAIVNEYLLNAFSPQSGEDDLSVSGMLDRAAARVEAELAGQPDVRGEVHNALGYWFSAFGRSEEAMEQHTLSLRYREQAYGPDDKRLVESLQQLSMYHGRNDRYEQAIALARRWARIAQATLPESDGLVGNGFGWLSEMLLRNGEYAEAEQAVRTALAIRERSGAGEWIVELTRAMLAVTLAAQDQFDEAEPMLIEAYARVLELRGPEGRFLQWIQELAELAYAQKDRPSPIG